MSSKHKIISELAPYSTMGIQLVITTGLFAWLGWYLDAKFDTAPIYLIVLTFVGAAAGMVTLIRTALRKKKN